MKAKKIIASICASAITISALALSVNAAERFEGYVNYAPVKGSISISNNNGALAQAWVGDNYLNYEVAQVKIDMDYTAKRNTNDFKISGQKSVKWTDGASSCCEKHPTGYTIIYAEAINRFNINYVTGLFPTSVGDKNA